MDVAGVEADGDGGAGSEALDEFGYLLELAAEGELGAGGVFDEDFEVVVLPGEAVDGALDGLGGEAEAFVAGEALPASGMEDEVLGAEGEGALDLSSKSQNGVGADGFGLAAEVDEIAGVDGDGADVVQGAELAHPGGVFGFDRGGAPHAGAGGEDLEGVGAGFDGAVDGGPAASGGAEMDADSLLLRGHCSRLTHGFGSIILPCLSPRLIRIITASTR